VKRGKPENYKQMTRTGRIHIHKRIQPQKKSGCVNDKKTKRKFENQVLFSCLRRFDKYRSEEEKKANKNKQQM